MLQKLGYAPGPADGVAGARTVSAVSNFQRRVGARATGRLNAAVFQLLRQQTAPAVTTAAGPEPVDVAQTGPGAPESRSGTGPDTAPATAAPAMAAAAAKTSAAPPVVPIFVAGSRWEIIDQTGSRQSLRLLSGGDVADAPTPAFWKWRLEGNRIHFDFNNLTGGWVRRTGHFTSANRIEGSAVSSRQRRWTWFAERR